LKQRRAGCGAHTGFWRIDENRKAGKGKIGFVGNCRGFVVRINQAAGNAEGAVSLPAQRRRAVPAPVRQIRMDALPLMTDVPANTAFDAPAGFSAPEAASPASFSAG
jgi:hypothetical protein